MLICFNYYRMMIALMIDPGIIKGFIFNLLYKPLLNHPIT